MVIHEKYCAQSLTRCKECNEVVDIDSLEEHHHEKHEIIECSHCLSKLNKIAYNLHRKGSCKAKDIQCQYCDLTMIQDLLDNHESMCGSQTDPCPACAQLITKKIGLDKHLEVCKGRSVNKVPSTLEKFTNISNTDNNMPHVYQQQNNTSNEDRELEEVLRLSMQDVNLNIYQFEHFVLSLSI